ncbi:kelch repeat-containing protein [Streptomyces sp. NPDC001698]|uniref:Kelch repeat-containing protein n=1 Tax=unclassified Streptomyces TaxID=2593676 RepID=UPI0036A8091E
MDGKVYSVGGYNGSAVVAKAYVHDPATQAWSPLPDMSTVREAPQAAAVDGKLYVFGGWGASGPGTIAKTEIYDPASGTWTTGANNPRPYAGAGVSVLGGKIYLVGGCGGDGCGKSDVQVYDPVADAWSSAHAYPEPTSWLGCAGIDKLYHAGGTGATASSKHTYAYDPSSNSWSSVADLPTALWAMGSTAANGQLLVSGGVANDTAITNQGFTYDPNTDAWTALPNSNNPLYRGGAACGFYKVGGAIGGFSAVRSSEALPGYDQCHLSKTDVPWLSEDKTDVTIQPGGSATITVTLDSNVIAQPGTFTAQLTITGKTPYPATSIPVTMVVDPPKTWGKITGTVTGVGCAGQPAPLAGAVVQVVSSKAIYTLKTDKNGHYQYWLDTRNSPLTVIAAKEGWASQATSAKITPQKTTTVDFTLKPDHTCN